MAPLKQHTKIKQQKRPDAQAQPPTLAQPGLGLGPIADSKDPGFQFPSSFFNYGFGPGGLVQNLLSFGPGSQAGITANSQLSQRVTKNIADGADHTVMEAALAAKFGSIDAVNAYYAALVPANFPSNRVKGYDTLVHPEFRDRLAKATAWLKSHKIGDTDALTVIEQHLSIGGFVIRPNTNHLSELSEHSFGFAIDINAALNPNIPVYNPPSKQNKGKKSHTKQKSNQVSEQETKLFPELVTAITGTDIYSGPDAEAIRGGGTAGDLIDHVRALSSASDRFKQSFGSETALQTTLVGYLKGQGLTLSQAQANDLFTRLKEAARQPTKLASPREPANKRLKSTKDKDASGAQGLRPSSAADQSTIEHWLIEARSGDTPWADASKIAELLVYAVQVFNKTTKGGKQVKAASHATPGTVAAHGFLNLPPELVAALVGTDGGGLEWLGQVERGHTKDFMHFELKRRDRKNILKAHQPAHAPAPPAP